MLFEDIDYNVKEYNNKVGFDPKFKDAKTILLKEYITDKLIDGYSTSYINTQLCNELGFISYGAKMLTNKCYKDMLRNVKKDSDDIKEKNYHRLTTLYRKALEDDDKKTQLECIRELNKMSGVYNTKIELSTNNFELKFGDE